MIRSSRTDPPLFYTEEDLRLGSRKTFYDRLADSDIDWKELSRPLEYSFCQDNGRPTDPVMYLKSFLVGYFEGIECDTDLAARLNDSMSIRRFLFGSLSGKTPDHWSLGRTRQLITQEDWAAILGRTVQMLKGVKLVAAEAVSIDTSLVPSRARRMLEEAPDAGSSVEQALARSDQVQAQTPKDSCGIPPEEQLVAQEKPKKRMHVVRSSYDLEAHIAKKPGYEAQPSYKITVATDHKSRAIVAAGATHASVGDSACARLSTLELVKTLGECPQHVVADKGMDDAGFHALVEFFGGSALTPLQRNPPTASGFGKERFFYDEDKDVYVCPAGKELALIGNPLAERLAYQAPAAICNECPLKLICFGKSKGPKRLNRTHDESSRERVIRMRKDPLRRKLLAERKTKAEPVFSDFKENGGLGQIWTKGLRCADANVKIRAIGWNIKLYLKDFEQRVPAKLKPEAPKVARGCSERPHRAAVGAIRGVTQYLQATLGVFVQVWVAKTCILRQTRRLA
jgi:hypothetical protein